MRSRQTHFALLGFPRREAFFRPLEAVVDGVADHMSQGIGEALDDGAVDLGALAVGLQPHVLAGGVGDFAHDARHALEQRPHRLRADRHHAFLNFARQMFEIVEAGGDARRLGDAGFQHALGQHRLVDDEFTDQIDEPVDSIQIDADRALLRVRIRRSGIGLRDGFGQFAACARLSVFADDFAGFHSFRASLSRRDLTFRGERGILGGPIHSFETRFRLDDLHVDGEVAVAIDKLEYAANRGFILLSAEFDVPGKVDGFRIEIVEGRNAFRLALDPDRPEPSEFANEAARLIALIVELRLGFERDAIDIAGGRRAR